MIRLFSFMFCFNLFCLSSFGQSARAPTNALQTAPSPSVKLINFTADWCPNCRRLNPIIDDTLSILGPGVVQRVDLDVTHIKRKSPEIQQATLLDVLKTAETHKASYLWDWYGGFTGIAVLIAADTGEPISCIAGLLSQTEIQERMETALFLVTNQPKGARKPNGPDCPAPMN